MVLLFRYPIRYESDRNSIALFDHRKYRQMSKRFFREQIVRELLQVVETVTFD